MKISELIAALNERMNAHGDVEVEITWESCRRDIDNSSIYLSKDGPLFIDADGKFYKQSFAVDPTEGEDEADAT